MNTRFRKLLKPIGIIISVVIIVFSLYMVGSSISNLQNIDEKYDAESQILAQKLNDASIKMLDICTTTNNLVDLRGCKSTSIPQIIEHCNDEQYPTTSVCSDVRLKEFSNTIDVRIESANKDYLNKMTILLSEIDFHQSKQIEHCYVLKTNLGSCKVFMIEIKNDCMEEGLRNIPSCNDPRIEEIINRVSLQSNDIIEDSNNQMMDFLASCMLEKTKSCVDSAKKSIELCNIDASVPACNDPRLDEIANYDLQTTQDTEIIMPQSTSEQIPIDTNLQAMYARTVRDCVEDTLVFDNFMLTIVNLDSISDGDERLISAYNGAERLNICSVDVREIESNYCYLFNPSCTETGKFETFWEVIPRLQSSFDQVCSNTGKLCGYIFSEK